MVRRRGLGTANLLRFIERSGRLKTERRRGWVRKLGLERPESVADHAYRTALITMIISDSRGLNTGRALRLALIHDLPEAVVGDAMPEERAGRMKIEKETAAMQELLRDLPGDLKSAYADAWLEFVEGRTKEAKLVRQVDKLEMAIQGWEYGRGLPSPAMAREFWLTARKHVSDKELLSLLRAVEV